MSVKVTVPAADSNQPSKFRNRTLWALQILAVLFFLAAGVSKLAGAKYNVVVFDKVGFGQWFRYFAGILEIVGAGMLLTPRFATLGGSLLAVVMAGAIIADRLALGGTGIPALIALVVVATIAWFRRSALTLPIRTSRRVNES
ncbi:doxX-like family protein [Burkholderia cenocepacia]|uniref:DoxX-like family protein n=1 Tax=Burkholderia cenocepacia TaxID=95486 RepID=A0AAN0VKS7_9BURK|nr:doxX-like family protein [Burkholderia cenocepacia]